MSEQRRIYTRIVIDMTQDDLPTVESESYLYDGPMALCVDGRGDSSQNNGRGDSESGNGSGNGSGGGDSDGMGGFGGYGGLGIGNPGSYGGSNDPGRTSEGGYSKSGGGGFGGLAGLNSTADAAAGYAGRAGVEGSGYMGGDPDMSGHISSMTGQQVTRSTQGYATEDGTRMAYSSGDPTSYGAHATARESDLGMSWNGAKAMSAAARDSRAVARADKAREIQARATAALKDPVALGIDPHMAKAAYDDAMHGMYDKAVSVGAMTAEDARSVRDAYGGLSGTFGFGLEDVTTPYENFVTAVEDGLVDPVTGKLTAKGWANVAAPAIGLLAGPLAQLGFSAFGLPGAIAGAMAPAAINAMSAPKKSTGLDTAADFAGHVTGIDASPFAAAAAWGDTMNTMGMAQNYAGTQPDAVGGAGPEKGDGHWTAFASRYAKFIGTAKNEKTSGINPRFQKRLNSRVADRTQKAAVQPQQQVQQAGFAPASYNRFFTLGV